MRVLFVLVLLPLAHGFLFWGSSSRQEAEADISEECKAKAEAGDCHFYTCFDERHPCTRHNWALSYGWRYCKRYDQSRSRFTSQGQRWINSSRLCTMQSLLEFYEDSHINCKDAENAMKESHAKCEKDNGVCNARMVMDNKQALLDIYTFSRQGLVRFLMYLRECGGQELDDFVKWAKEQRQIAKPYLDSVQGFLAGIAAADWSFDEWSFDLPELPELPDLPALPELPSFEWPGVGFRWPGRSAHAAESAESSEEAEPAADEIH